MTAPPRACAQGRPASKIKRIERTRKYGSATQPDNCRSDDFQPVLLLVPGGSHALLAGCDRMGAQSRLGTDRCRRRPQSSKPRHGWDRLCQERSSLTHVTDYVGPRAVNRTRPKQPRWFSQNLRTHTWVKKSTQDPIRCK